MLGAVTFLMPTLAFKRSARATLSERLPSGGADQLLGKAINRQAELRQSRPHHSIGVNLLIKYMEWDAALYQVALEDGLAKEEAGKLIEAINWRIFKPATNLTFHLSRLRSSKLLTRVQWMTDLLFKTMFTAPFQYRNIPTRDQVAFDVTQCPLAKYFRDLGIPELTKYAACSLDHYMAAQWGMTLQRTTTIGEGAPLCDFRFRVNREK